MPKILMIHSGVAVTKEFIVDDAIAEKAYADIIAAMGSYREYGNDEAKIVTVALDAGNATYCLRTLGFVTLTDCEQAEASIIAREVWARTLETKIAARLAPATE